MSDVAAAPGQGELALIARHFDRATAERVARDAEYLWNASSEVDPFAADAAPATR